MSRLRRLHSSLLRHHPRKRTNKYEAARKNRKVRNPGVVMRKPERLPSQIAPSSNTMHRAAWSSRVSRRQTEITLWMEILAINILMRPACKGFVEIGDAAIFAVFEPYGTAAPRMR